MPGTFLLCSAVQKEELSPQTVGVENLLFTRETRCAEGSALPGGPIGTIWVLTG